LRFFKRTAKRRTSESLKPAEEIRLAGETATSRLRDLQPMLDVETPDGSPFSLFPSREDYVDALGRSMVELRQFPDAVEAIGALLDAAARLNADARELAMMMGSIAEVGLGDAKRAELQLKHLWRRNGPLHRARKYVKSLAPLPLEESQKARAYATFRFASEELPSLVPEVRKTRPRDPLELIRNLKPWIASRIESHPRKKLLLAYIAGTDEPLDLGKAGSIARWVAAEIAAHEAGLKGKEPARLFLRDYADAVRSRGEKKPGKSARRERGAQLVPGLQQ
jgi:hypothetical protein